MRTWLYEWQNGPPVERGPQRGRADTGGPAACQANDSRPVANAAVLMRGLALGTKPYLTRSWSSRGELRLSLEQPKRRVTNLDKSIAGLIGAMGALAAGASAHAASAVPNGVVNALQASSYGDLLKPIPNAKALLQASDASPAATAADAGGDPAIQTVQYRHHHHHHHRYVRRRYHHHHHHQD